MKQSDRRLAHRFRLAIPLYIRLWKSQAPEQKVDSINVSPCGVYYETDTPPGEGAIIQLRLQMPTEITGYPTDEWKCIGKVLRIQPSSIPGASRGVSVRFDYYEVLHAVTPRSVITVLEAA